MGRELTILERLRRGQGPDRSAVENTNQLVRSVQANITRILNARVEHAPAQPDYGVPAPSEIVYGFPTAVQLLQRRIRDTVTQYEPRISDVEVVHVESTNADKLVLQYQLQARLTASTTGSWIDFVIRFEPSGRITLRR